jgi:hypothetical protein
MVVGCLQRVFQALGPVTSHVHGQTLTKRAEFVPRLELARVRLNEPPLSWWMVMPVAPKEWLQTDAGKLVGGA